ncbi:LamG domain-containing protein [Lewinella cohaerens]|uniref:LamG domain-containing protein n=1 Tax=Lewinella cohaerens TaxID=70995 RepID=UPI00037606BA|nr:LamG domain-containing protein [Lewinella cohaerens]
MKTLKFLLLLCCSWQVVAGQNALHFERNADDFIQLPLVATSLAGNPASYTVECWFNPQNTNLTEFRRLFSFGGTNTRIEVGQLGGQLVYFIQGGVFNNTGVNNITPIGVNVWQHLALVKNGAQIDFYLDCVLVGSTPSLAAYTFNITNFRLGRWPGGAAAAADWQGLVDELRIWDTALIPAEICGRLNCPLAGNESNLFAYWTFDETTIVPGGVNTSLTQVMDFSGNGNNGNIINFGLTGSTSNFVALPGPLVYPALHNLSLEIRDYPYRNNLLTGICDGDPAHFCLYDNGQTPGPFGNVNVQWQYSDNGGTLWSNLVSPPFTGFCFPILPGILTTDCTSAGSQGFVDRKYRAVSTVSGPGALQCTYVSDEYDLQICCPIGPATISIVPSGPFCEGELVNFQVTLNASDPFVSTPGPNVTIDWFFNDPATGRIPIPSAFNQTSLTYNNWTAPFPPGGVPGSYCFEAEVRNCQGKLAVFSQCVMVDPQPVCGTIDGAPLGSPTNLNLVSATPLVYEICPGNDAQLTIATPFQYCIPQWQYTFTNPGTGTPVWTDMGLSNSLQNTNILPSYLWPPAATSIYYRIQCNPLSSPSACDPCYSDWLEIRLISAPLVPTISGINQVCLEDLPETLMVNSPQAGVNYQWYLDGLPIGTGTSISATAGGCYWLEASNGCQTVEGPQFCLEVCETVAVLSCPITPNECASLGDPITLSACDSYTICSSTGPLSYEWFIDNVSQGPASAVCTLTDTPAITGTTYKVIVTDTLTGCVGEAERTVVPCDKNP